MSGSWSIAAPRFVCRAPRLPLPTEPDYLPPDPELALVPEPELTLVPEPELLAADVPLPWDEVAGAEVPLPLVEVPGLAVPLEHALKDNNAKHTSRPELIESTLFMSLSLKIVNVMLQDGTAG